MKRNKKEILDNIFSVNESSILATGEVIKNRIINEESDVVDVNEFENELIDVYATTIAINQMVADRTLKTIACSVPITNTVASIDSVNIYDPDGRLNLVSNSTFSGAYGKLERNNIPDLEPKVKYKKGDLFKNDGVVYEAVVDDAEVSALSSSGIARAFYAGMIRYCSEAKTGDIRSFSEAGEVDIKNINFRGRVKSRTAYLSLTPEALMDKILGVDAHLNEISVGIETIDGDIKNVRVNRLILSMAQYIANERNKDIVHTAMCIAKKDEVLDFSSNVGPSYQTARLLALKIKDTASSVSKVTKQIANYVVVSERVSNYLSISGFANKYTNYTPSSYSYGNNEDGMIEPDHIHTGLYLGDLEVVVDKSADFDYYMVGVNNREYNISGIYLSDQEFILPIKDFGINIDTEAFMNFGSTKLLTATEPNGFAKRILALSKYALTIYPHSDLLNEEDSRIQFTDEVSNFANKSELIRFVGVELPSNPYKNS